MVEPFAIATGTAGLVSFLVTIRNTTSQIVKDRDAVRNETVNLLRAARRLAMIWDRLLWWRRIWNIRPGVPEDLFIAYWGDKSGSIIHTHEDIISSTTKLIEDLWSRHGAALNYAGFNKELDLARTTQNMLDADFQYILDRIEKEEVRIKRIAQALFRAEVREKSIESLTKLMDSLEKDSKDLFERWNPSRSVDNIADRIIKDTIKEDCNRASALKRELKAATDCLVDLCLYEQDDSDLRSTVFDDRGSPEQFSLNFYIGAANKAMGPRELLRCKFHSYTEVDRNFCGFENVWKGFLQSDYRPDMLKKRFRCRENKNTFELKRQIHRVSNSSEDLSLRSQIMNRGIGSARSLYSTFRKRERARLAQNLSWYSALFLHTEWFSDLCSCQLYFGQNDRDRARLPFGSYCRVRIICTEHAAPTPAEGSAEEPCIGRTQADHCLRRLGMLLAEIALGHEISLVDEEDPFMQRELLGEHLEGAMGLFYRDVVEYCLYESEGPGFTTIAHAKAVYLEVIQQ